MIETQLYMCIIYYILYSALPYLTKLHALKSYIQLKKRLKFSIILVNTFKPFETLKFFFTIKCMLLRDFCKFDIDVYAHKNLKIDFY